MRICDVLHEEIEVCDEINEEIKERDKNLEKDDSDFEIDYEEFQEIKEKEISPQKNTIKKITPHSLTLILWAFGKNRMKDEELFEMISGLIIKNFQKFTAKMLNIVLYAYKSVKMRAKVVNFFFFFSFI